MSYLERTATLSASGIYRYRLGRRWSVGRRALFVMLNPSIGDMDVDDPTLVRCMNYAKDWNLAGIDVVNLFAYRTPKPKVLFNAHRDGVDIVGPDNCFHTRNALDEAGIVIAAWGANARPFKDQERAFTRLAAVCGRDLYCLATTDSWGEPRHPLMLKLGLQPKIWMKCR